MRCRATHEIVCTTSGCVPESQPKQKMGELMPGKEKKKRFTSSSLPPTVRIGVVGLTGRGREGAQARGAELVEVTHALCAVQVGGLGGREEKSVFCVGGQVGPPAWESGGRIGGMAPTVMVGSASRSSRASYLWRVPRVSARCLC